MTVNVKLRAKIRENGRSKNISYRNNSTPTSYIQEKLAQQHDTHNSSYPNV